MREVNKKLIDQVEYVFDTNEYNMGLPDGTILRFRLTNSNTDFRLLSINSLYSDYPVTKTIKDRLDERDSTGFYSWGLLWGEYLGHNNDERRVKAEGVGSLPHFIIDRIIFISLPERMQENIIVDSSCCLWMNHPYYCCSKKGIS